ncbi:glycosyl transferase [Aliidongia dinghuensis]|uniref:Glycosyl transferase n=1 Tax=Aliidongia dinghuensis TaxID=1867774 RepID=A0A8J2YNP4_9PROT|nr:glycosyltransferase [Aliidongia dinghuensis]GGE99264.1 glycosyl transferase [Aliidongia dinghuensis]
MTAAAILLVLSLLFLGLAAHPFVSYPMSLRFVTRGRGAQRPDSSAPPLSTGMRHRFAVCVCAYNEAACIERKVENMLELRQTAGGDLDILVYVDGSSDRTAELLEPYADRITLVVSPERRGKTYGMNLLVSRTSADVIVFTDANVRIDPTAIAAIDRRFADPQVGCVCGHLIYTNGEETATAEVGSLYWRLEETIKRHESAFGAVMGADGSLFAIRRNLHRAVPANLIDDMFVSLGILCDGYKVVTAPDALAYEASVTSSKEEFRRKVRIACQAFNVHRELWPRLKRLPAAVVYMYLSHKLLRWVAAFNLALSALFAAAGLFVMGVPAAALALLAILGTGMLWASIRFQLRPLSSIAEILVALAGASLGVIQSLRGHQFQTWTPASSIRRVGH